ncbi:MAG: MCE family protein [Bacteroidota bacterium]|nr:MCE family protein [Bacteroidota bacterium]
MAKKVVSNVKLGVFVLAGLLFLVILLYMIGKNRNLFGSNYVLKARFENIQGLVTGNNVRFSGIQAGTVKRIDIINDTLIEVTMVIDKKMSKIIHKNAVASISTEGLVGNKVVNISPSKIPDALAKDDDILPVKKAVNTDEIMETLYNTNSDVAIIAAGLRTTVERINKSSALWNLLNDESIPENIRISFASIRSTTGKAVKIADDLDKIILGVKNGEGSLGAILKDTSLVKNLNDAILTINKVGNEADSVTVEINKLVKGVHEDVSQGKGTVNALLKDSMMVKKIEASLDNIQKGTDGFNSNMEALKHNFLFRGYFRKLEKQKKKAQ